MFALSNKFNLTLPLNKRELDLNVQSIDGLGLAVNSLPQAYQGFTHYIPGDSIQFDPLTLTVLLDEDYEIFKSLITEIFSLVNPKTGKMASPERFDGILSFHDPKNRVLFKLVFKDCWISGFSAMDRDVKGDDTPTVIQLSLIYDSFEIQ